MAVNRINTVDKALTEALAYHKAAARCDAGDKKPPLYIVKLVKIVDYPPVAVAVRSPTKADLS